MNNARQKECLDFVFKWKGKGKILRDRDGITKWGICSRFFPGEDVENMTRERAEEILLATYWPDGLDFPLDLLVFDGSVNCGVSRSIRWLQATINGLIPRDHIKVDGILGPITRKAVHYCDQEKLVLGMLYRRFLWYHQLRRVRRENYAKWIGRMIDIVGILSNGCFQ